MPATRVVSVRAAVLGLAVAAATGWLPVAALGTSAIPADQTGDVLDGNPITAIVGDIDGDGVRELISLGPRDDDPVHLAVEVLEEGPDGDVISAGSAPLTRMASVTEQLSGLPRPDENNLLQARVDEPARLVAWHERGREHVLAMAIGTLRNARACCLSIWAVERGGDGIRLRLMTDTMRSADQVRAVDMDADGTDELVVTEPRQDANPDVLPIAVLKWDGQRFRSQSAPLRVLGDGPLIPLGDSDERRGDEVGLVRATRAAATLHRIALGRTAGCVPRPPDCRLTAPSWPLTGPTVGAWYWVDEAQGAVVLRWPAGGRIERDRAIRLARRALATVGEGASVAVVKLRDVRLLDLFGPRLGTDPNRPGQQSGGGTIPSATTSRRTSVRCPAVPPAARPSSSEAAWSAPDRSGRGGGVTVTDTSTMPGITPIGLFGTDSELLAMALTRPRPGCRQSVDATREGGQLSRPAGLLRSATIVVSDAAAALSPEADDGLLQPDPQGPVRVEQGTDEPVVLAGGAFTLPVARRRRGRGCELVVGEAVTDEQVPEDGVAQLRVGLDGVRRRRRGARHARWPSRRRGRGTAVTGSSPSIRSRRRSAPARPWHRSASTSASRGGRRRTPAWRWMGRRCRSSPTAGSTVAVSAGLWPRDVHIVATDPLGNRTATTIGVVALLDYRQLPWIPIVALLTILVGMILYLRVPHVRPATASGQMTDATLEDLD